MGSMNVKQMVEQRIGDMEVLPNVVMKLLSFTDDDDHSLKDVVAVIQNDPSLTTSVLRVANSAAYAPRTAVTTLSRAIVMLGEKMVTGIAIGSCLSHMYNDSLDGYESVKGEFWNHSLRSAIAAKQISGYALKDIQGDFAFTAGLLHDIGKSVISDFLIGSSEMLRNWLESGQVEDFIQAERNLLGTDHAEVGYAISVKWGLPEILCDVIKYHHQPGQAPEEERGVLYTVHLGDMVAQLGGSGTGSDNLAYKIDENYKDYINIDERNLDLVFLQVQDEFWGIKSEIFSSDRN